MTKTSIIPKNWANGPFTPLSTPQSQGLDINSHFSVHLATQMVHIHNLFIRSINSLILQSPHVSAPADIADLLFYSKTLVKTIEGHHDTEEQYFFPDLEAYTENPQLMAQNEAQHHVFHAALEAFGQYCHTTTPSTYSYSEYSSLLNAFATPLHTHLGDEIPTLLELKFIPSKDLKAMWDRCEKHALEGGSMDEFFPFVFGCVDSSFEGGKFAFPPVPGVVKFAVDHWFARKHKGAWRFNPSDMWGKPRELVFLPKEGGEKSE